MIIEILRVLKCVVGALQSAMAEKMRREVARLSQETERLEKEVSRQKALR